MIIYNVTVKVDLSIAAAWQQWMKEEHLPEMMQTGLFLDYKMCRLLEQDEQEGATFVVQYNADSKEHYQTYISEHAPKMRQKGLDKFGGKFAAFRTVMEVIN